MKEELLRVLNNKLDDISSDIDSLVELNNKISTEEEDLAYVSSILELFNNGNENHIMNFAKLEKADFQKILGILGTEVQSSFDSASCNYDGLVYLINGINNGVLLTLTDEQKNNIEYLIHKLDEKQSEHMKTISDYQEMKNRYVINDVEKLKEKKEAYNEMVSELTNHQYVKDTDLLLEALEFSETSDEDMVGILKYLLEYNADIYKTMPKEEINSKKVTEESDTKFEQIGSFNDDMAVPFHLEENERHEEVNDDLPSDESSEFHFNELDKDDFTNYTPLSFSDYNEEKSTVTDENNDSITYVPELNEMAYQDDESNSISLDNKEEDNTSDNEEETKENNFLDKFFDNIRNKKSDEDNEPEEVQNEKELSSEDDLVNEENLSPIQEISNNEENELTEETVSNSDIQDLLAKYNITFDDAIVNELATTDISNYNNILEILSENNILEEFKKNNELLIETLQYSSDIIIQKILDIIRNELSVDEDDYIVTTKIVINTIPSIFIENGNYDNFIKNIRVFKELDINIINLFDFSKEIFVANNDTILNNLDVVNKYDVQITYQNAKYLLLLPNIADRIDYYVESVYEDPVKKETFDGLEYINEYTAKLNVITDETIKRLRYCSENGKKIFGNKPKSLVGEITNLKVNSLDITGEYLSKFFNNEFAILTGDEVREYIKLIHNSSNFGNYDDELDILEPYHNGPRYVIENINISYNKVLRNYSILRSYGIDTYKSLHFAVCYNLVITKEEYDILKNKLDELGGNR